MTQNNDCVRSSSFDERLKPPSSRLIASQPTRKKSQRRSSSSCGPLATATSTNSISNHHRRTSVATRKSVRKPNYERSQSASATSITKSMSSSNLSPNSCLHSNSFHSHSHPPSPNPSVQHNPSIRSSASTNTLQSRSSFIVPNERSQSVSQQQIDNHLSDLSENLVTYKSERKKSLWNEVKNLRQTRRSSKTELFAVVCVAIIKDAGSLILTVIVAVLMISIGLAYISECPQASFIPIYLLLTGILGIVNQTYNYKIHRKTPDILEDHSRDSIVLRITFMCLCFIVGCGSYWVLKIYEPNYNANSGDDYCNKFVYFFAFWITIMIYVVVLILPFICYIYDKIKKSCNEVKPAKKPVLSATTSIPKNNEGGIITVDNIV